MSQFHFLGTNVIMQVKVEQGDRPAKVSLLFLATKTLQTTLKSYFFYQFWMLVNPVSIEQILFMIAVWSVSYQ